MLRSLSHSASVYGRTAHAWHIRITTECDDQKPLLDENFVRLKKFQICSSFDFCCHLATRPYMYIGTVRARFPKQLRPNSLSRSSATKTPSTTTCIQSIHIQRSFKLRQLSIILKMKHIPITLHTQFEPHSLKTRTNRAPPRVFPSKHQRRKKKRHTAARALGKRQTNSKLPRNVESSQYPRGRGAPQESPKLELNPPADVP